MKQKTTVKVLNLVKQEMVASDFFSNWTAKINDKDSRFQ